MTKIKTYLANLKTRAKTLWQLIAFLAMGGITGIVDLLAFALFSFAIFTKFSQTGFNWWLFDYGVENGGLCAFLSLACSFAISQTVNFFLQRKVTFSATTNLAYSAVMYAVMVLGVYFVILWLPTLYIEPVCRLLGESLGVLVVKLSTQTISALIQFPINKWVIMRSDKAQKDETA